MVLLVAPVSCMDPLVNYEECKEIEERRCRHRHWCLEKADDDSALPDRFPDFRYDNCVSYANEHCRTRELGQTPGMKDSEGNYLGDMESCLLAIQNVPCETLDPGLDETTDLPECRFIDPIGDSEEDVDAGADTDDTDDTDEDAG
jgi:hypothetical protein